MEVSPPRGFASSLVRYTGSLVSWLTLVMVLVTGSIVVMRYGFDRGWIWLWESVTYLHAAVFMLAAAWAWQSDDHVRVDIFYRGKSARHKAWVDLIGTLVFLVPLAVFMLLMSWDYVAASWAVHESSGEAGGLPYVYLLKSLILALPVLLLVQAWVCCRQCFRTLRA